MDKTWNVKTFNISILYWETIFMAKKPANPVVNIWDCYNSWQVQLDLVFPVKLLENGLQLNATLRTKLLALTIKISCW